MVFRTIAGILPLTRPWTRPKAKTGAGIPIRTETTETAHGCWLLTEMTSPLM